MAFQNQTVLHMLDTLQICNAYMTPSDPPRPIISCSSVSSNTILLLLLLWQRSTAQSFITPRGLPVRTYAKDSCRKSVVIDTLLGLWLVQFVVIETDLIWWSNIHRHAISIENCRAYRDTTVRRHVAFWAR